MVGSDKHCYCSDFINGANQLAFGIPGKVAQVEEAKLVEGKQHTDATGVVRWVVGHRFSRGARWIDPNVRAAQMEMERTLGMRVRIKDRNGKGKIVIEYATVDDYERVVEMLRGRANT